ncbi:MAG TPA: radical SAM protein [Candidatus Lokiarchaeia archaeon]|nr:radical SAM protein [Candidatus Lokiarchaeia archaeon]
MKALIIDAITLGEGRRDFTRDFIGAGPRMVAATIRARSKEFQVTIARGEDFIHSRGRVGKGFDACFVSAMTMDKPSVATIAHTWKMINPEKPVIVGGPVALEPRDLLRNHAVDAVVPGEAEQVLLDTLDIVDAGELATQVPDGFITRSNLDGVEERHGYPSKWPSTGFIEHHVDPAIDLLRCYDNHWAARVYIECLRGCSNLARARIDNEAGQACEDCGFCDSDGNYDVTFSCPAGTLPGCGFCSTAAVSGPVRSFSEKYIIDQVARCIDLGCHRIVLGGSDFLEYQRESLMPPGSTTPAMSTPPNHDALDSIVSRFLDFTPIQQGDVQLFIENIKASLCDDESIRTIARIPGVSVSIGVESGSDEHLARIGKRYLTVATIKKAVSLLEKYKVRYHAYFIHSLPGQTPATVTGSVELMKWLERNGVDKITIYRFKPLPGTAFQGMHVPKAKIDEAAPMIQEAERINEARKDGYVDTTCKVLIAEMDFRDKSSAIAYMLGGGPKVKLPGCRDLVNDMQMHLARITTVISDKMVEGTLLE